jgi:hypothetical protein
VAPAHQWKDVRAQNRKKPVVVPSTGMASLQSPDTVQRAWERFEQKGKETGPILCPVRASGEPKRYRPMQREHATLFHRFAALDYRDREAIRAFATEYGLLGVPSKRGIGESHLTWAREICLMREALKLGQPVTAAAETRDRAIWSQHDAEISELRSQFEMEPYDPVEIRHRERREKLTWLFNVHLQNVQGRMTFTPDGPPRLTLTPLSLLAAMWLQLALAAAGDKQFLACKFCRRIFEISTEQTGFRSHREFCSGACKTKDYRRRKRTALQLATKSLSVREIAKATQTEIATVRAWTVSGKRRSTTTTKKKRRSRT